MLRWLEIPVVKPKDYDGGSNDGERHEDAPRRRKRERAKRKGGVLMMQTRRRKRRGRGLRKREMKGWIDGYGSGERVGQRS